MNHEGGDYKRKRNASAEMFLSLPSSKNLRSGKWTPQEENYANRLVYEFENGLLEDCGQGCTLRAYMAAKLQCAPMRISKKYAGRNIGKLEFTTKHSDEPYDGSLLKNLEWVFLESLGQKTVNTMTGTYNETILESADSGMESARDSFAIFYNKPSSSVSNETRGAQEVGKKVEVAIPSVSYTNLSNNIYTAPAFMTIDVPTLEQHEWLEVLSSFCGDDTVTMYNYPSKFPMTEISSDHPF